MNYEWTVTNLTSATIFDLNNVVINVKWTCKGTDENGNFGSFYGATPLTTQDIDPATFVPFDQLTEELVLSWVQLIVINNKEYWQHIQKVINTEIVKKSENINPNAPLPWNPEPNSPLPTEN